LGQSLAREFGPQGIHVAHVIIDGQVDNERQVKVRESAFILSCSLANLVHLKGQPERPLESFMKSVSIAEQYWQLHVQDRTVWTQVSSSHPLFLCVVSVTHCIPVQELDLRPHVEKW